MFYVDGDVKVMRKTAYSSNLSGESRDFIYTRCGLCQPLWLSSPVIRLPTHLIFSRRHPSLYGFAAWEGYIPQKPRALYYILVSTQWRGTVVTFRICTYRTKLWTQMLHSCLYGIFCFKCQKSIHLYIRKAYFQYGSFICFYCAWWEF